MARTLDQILEKEKPEVVVQAWKRAEEILLGIHLAELREMVQKTQRDVAHVLGIKQPTVAEMEKPGRDLRFLRSCAAMTATLKVGANASLTDD